MVGDFKEIEYFKDIVGQMYIRVYRNCDSRYKNLFKFKFNKIL